VAEKVSGISLTKCICGLVILAMSVFMTPKLTEFNILNLDMGCMLGLEWESRPPFRDLWELKSDRVKNETCCVYPLNNYYSGTLYL
jgi:hypothetical protein